MNDDRNELPKSAGEILPGAAALLLSGWIASALKSEVELITPDLYQVEATNHMVMVSVDLDDCAPTFCLEIVRWGDGRAVGKSLFLSSDDPRLLLDVVEGMPL